MPASTIYEPVMIALFNYLNSKLIPGVFRYSSRRFLPWEQLIQGNIPPGFAQPAFFLYDGIGAGGGKTRFEQRGMGHPSKRTMFRSIVVYAQLPGSGTADGPDSTTPGGTIFAPLSEAIENAIQTPDYPTGVLTLGGIVSHVWIEGESHWLTPDFEPTGQGVMTIPINIVIP